MSEPTNADRAAWARASLELYAQTTGISGEDMATKFDDLLASLRHLANQEGVDFEGRLSMSEIHYAEENDLMWEQNSRRWKDCGRCGSMTPYFKSGDRKRPLCLECMEGRKKKGK